MVERFHGFVSNPEKNLLLILGDFGAGKTTLLRHLMNALSKRELSSANADQSRTPLLISLRDYNNVPNWDSLMRNFLTDEIASDRPSLLRVYRRLNESGNLLLLLDGFDEMADLVTRAKRRVTFESICGQLTQQSKVVLTGRPGYFPDTEEMADVLNEFQQQHDKRDGRTLFGHTVPPNVDIVCLQLLDSQQQERLFRSKADRETRAIARLMQDPRIADLARRPVLANLIAESAPDLVRRGGEIGLRQVYDTYCGRWIRRDERKGRLLIDADTKASFMGLLAMQMHNESRFSIHYSKLDQRITGYFGIARTDELDHFSSDIRTCSFLVRDDAGHYEFVHRSFQEYFVAVQVALRSRSVYKDQLVRPMTSDILAFVDQDTLPTNAQEILGLDTWSARLVVVLETAGAADSAQACEQEFSRESRALDIFTREWPGFESNRAATIRNNIAQTILPELVTSLPESVDAIAQTILPELVTSFPESVDEAELGKLVRFAESFKADVRELCDDTFLACDPDFVGLVEELDAALLEAVFPVATFALIGRAC